VYALGTDRIASPDSFDEAAKLLRDSTMPVRIAAIKALPRLDPLKAIELLRIEGEKYVLYLTMEVTVPEFKEATDQALKDALSRLTIADLIEKIIVPLINQIRDNQLEIQSRLFSVSLISMAANEASRRDRTETSVYVVECFLRTSPNSVARKIWGQVLDRLQVPRPDGDRRPSS
jgi:hypothetical protein